MTAPPARAQDAPPADTPAPGAGQTDDPRDLNHDGVVTRKEKRQYRRKQRGTGDGAAPSAPPTDAAAGAAASSDATAADASASRSQAAMKRASGAAAVLKNSLSSAEAAGAGGGADRGRTGAAASAGPARAGGTAAAAGASGDPANPHAASDFVLAARSGYAPAFAAAGLKLSADGRAVVRLDGSPASADDLARLRAGIAAMPSALARRPDFFSRVSPERFADLKQGYRTQPGPASPVYRHVGLTEADRDFVHTQSCAKLSDACNASVAKSSYKKGEFVAPEDLDRMWGSLQKELDADASSEAPSREGRTTSSSGADAPAAATAGAPAAEGAAPRAAGTAASPDASASAAAPLATATAAARRFLRATRAVFGGPDGARGHGAAWPWAAMLAGALALGIWNVRRRG